MNGLTLRPGGPGDGAALRRIAGRDCADPLPGRTLLAETGGETIAAISLADGRVVADPFRPTADAVELLRRRAAQIRAAERGPTALARLSARLSGRQRGHSGSATVPSTVAITEPAIRGR